MPCNRQRTERANAILGAMKGRGVMSASEIREQVGLTPGEFATAMKYLSGNGQVLKVGRDPHDVKHFLWVRA